MSYTESSSRAVALHPTLISNSRNPSKENPPLKSVIAIQLKEHILALMCQITKCCQHGLSETANPSHSLTIEIKVNGLTAYLITRISDQS